MKRSHKGLAALATMATSMAGGCGGGSSSVTITDVFTTESSTTSTLAPASAQGLYEGVASNGHFFNTLVLENDQYYIIYGNLAGELFTVTGLITGTGQSSGGGFNSADLKDFTPGGVVFVGSMSASFTPDVRFDGVVSVRGQGISFPGNSLPVERYNHDTPAGLAEIAGAWTMTSLQGAGTSLSVADNGDFTGVSDGCNFSGTFKPRAGGKNVFDANFSFGSSPCIMANQTVTGHAVNYLQMNGQQQLIHGSQRAGRSAATAFAGTR